MDFTKEIDAYYDREKAAIDKLDRKELNAAMNALLDAYEREATVYVFGNGGSSATASHMVCDFNKGTCYDLKKKFHFVCLNDNIPVMMAIANDDSFENVFVYQLSRSPSKERPRASDFGVGELPQRHQGDRLCEAGRLQDHWNDRLRRWQAR
jgi:D-sedoheptulose 7-phosphate isomerase